MAKEALISLGTSALKEVVAVFTFFGVAVAVFSNARREFGRVMLEWTSPSVPTLSLQKVDAVH
jgi:hypothetical protein